MARELLVLGAGRGQVGLINAAKELGCRVSVATMVRGGEPGIPLAEEVIAADISSPSEVLDAIGARHFDGVATSCMDTPLAALAAVAEKLGLPGLSQDAAARCSNKIAMKQAFKAEGVRTAPSKILKKGADLRTVAGELELPIVVKAPDLQGSRGVFICTSWEQAQDAAGKAWQESKSDELVVEEFIEGREFGAQAMIADGEILFVELHGDDVYSADTNIPIVHYMPIDMGDEVAADARKQTAAAIRAVGLNDCAVNIDLIERDGEVFVIEVTGRVGANGLPELMSARLGLNYYETVAKLALGQTEDLLKSDAGARYPALLGQMLFYLGPTGIIEKMNIDFSDPSVLHSKAFVEVGDEARTFKSSNDCIGEVLVAGESLGECREIAQGIQDSVYIRVDRE